jgi:lysocardiolipin and lysophospholipid acyltransferase
MENLRQRHAPVEMQSSKPATQKPKPSMTARPHPEKENEHPAWHQALRMVLFSVYFNGSILA